MRHWLFGAALTLLGGCSDPSRGHEAQQIAPDEVRSVPINPGLTPVSLFGDDLSDVIFRSVDMMTGTSMGVRVTVLANTGRLSVSAGDASEENLFGRKTTDWTKSSFAAVPFTGGASPKPNVQPDNRTNIALEVHEGVCWHDDIQIFQKFRGSHLVGTYAVIASVETAPDQNGYDDLTNAKTGVNLYVLRKAEPPMTGFAGVFEPIEFSFLATTQLPKASCHPSEMLPDYKRLVQSAELPPPRRSQGAK